MSPTVAPPSARASAILAETVLFPTPPLPLTTAIIFLTPLNICKFSFRVEVVLAVKFTCTLASLLTSNLTAFSLAVRIMSFMGQAGVVSTMVKLTSLPLTFTSFTIFKVTRSFPKSGSCTLLRACNIASSVMVTQVFVKIS